jgi:hypothetical protein
MRVKRGEIYIAASGSKCGHLVIDVEKYKGCDDIVTQPFGVEGKYGLDLSEFVPKEIYHNEPNRIDKFKLTMVRYYRCDDVPLPDWIPSEIIEMRAKL